jgi:hypothetical protein
MLDWQVTPAADGTLPSVLTVTINSKDLPTPPATLNRAIDGEAGTVRLAGLEPDKRYDVFVSSATADGLASESVRRDLPAA